MSAHTLSLPSKLNTVLWNKMMQAWVEACKCGGLKHGGPFTCWASNRRNTAPASVCYSHDPWAATLNTKEDETGRRRDGTSESVKVNQQLQAATNQPVWWLTRSASHGEPLELTETQTYSPSAELCIHHSNGHSPWIHTTASPYVPPLHLCHWTDWSITTKYMNVKVDTLMPSRSR